jgi:hypothetical protein
MTYFSIVASLHKQVQKPVTNLFKISREKSSLVCNTFFRINDSHCYPDQFFCNYDSVFYPLTRSYCPCSLVYTIRTYTGISILFINQESVTCRKLDAHLHYHGLFLVNPRVWEITFI